MDSTPGSADAALLEWDEAAGVGRYPVDLSRPVYDKAYWDKYVAYAATPLGAALTGSRIRLVRKHAEDRREVVDIGIGCGQFVAACQRFGVRAGGYDVNETAVRWLVERGLWRDPWFRGPEHATCWDSLEHMERPDLFVDRVKGTLFVSIPIFANRAHVLVSRHFRPDEHFWYFTRQGLVRWMDARGLDCVEQNTMETDLGRDGIGTFVFRRRGR